MNKTVLFLLVIVCFIKCNDVDQSKELVEVSQKKDFNLSLPIYGVKEYIKGIDEDTIYHTIPDWSFVNQNGDTVFSKDYLGHIYVADFFFTSCPSICPKMTINMVKLQEKAKGLNVKFLSYTVDPKRDNSETLKQYQDDYEINGDNWDLITGDQYKIYELGVKGFLVPNQEDALAPGGFLHSEKMMLIDPRGRIRGYYDGTDESQMDMIINDINKLKIERDTINRN